MDIRRYTVAASSTAVMAAALLALPVVSQPAHAQQAPQDEQQPETQPEGERPAPPEGEGQAQPEPEGEGDREREGREGRGRRGMRGGMGGMGMLNPRILDRFLEPLGLNEEQRAKIQEIGERQSEEVTTFLSERMTKFFDEAATVLNDEQKTQLDGIRAMLEQRQAGGRRSEDGTQARRTRGERGERGQFGRGSMRERMVEQAKRALALPAEDEAIILPLVDSAITAQTEEAQTVRDKRRELDAFITGGDASPAELQTRLDELRKLRDEAEATVRARQEELRSVLTLEQEAKLVGLGVLR